DYALSQQMRQLLESAQSGNVRIDQRRNPGAPVSEPLLAPGNSNRQRAVNQPAAASQQEHTPQRGISSLQTSARVVVHQPAASADQQASPADLQRVTGLHPG